MPHLPSKVPLGRFPLALLAVLLLLLGISCRDDDLPTAASGDGDLDAPDTTPIAGALPGHFSVSITGEARYHIQLTVPPGIAGMQPTLGIAYSSTSGNGLLGMGFSLTGLSAITRCARTTAQDGRIRAVHNDAGDAICLDGSRLIPVNKKLGITEYRTFPDTQVKVLGFDDASPDNPASTWEVHTRDGHILDYGGHLNANVLGKDKVIRSWLLRDVRDQQGNTVAYTYQNLRVGEGYTVQHAPLRILYTGHGNAEPSQRIEFSYEGRAESDTGSFYAGGLQQNRDERIARISMFGPTGGLVREYRFAYNTSAGTGRTLLANIKECAADNTCKPRTSFAWSGGKAGFERIGTNVPVPRSSLSAPMLLDLDGDGLDDLIVPAVPWSAEAHAEIPTTNWTVYPNTGEQPFLKEPILAYAEDHNDFSNDPILQGQPDLQVQPDYGTPIDYDHDGRTDILVHDVHGTSFSASNNWQVLHATDKRTFEVVDTGIPRPKHLLDGGYKLGSPEGSAHLADVTGDGMSDLIQCERDETAGGGDSFIWTLRRWTPEGPGFETKPRLIEALSLFHCAWPLYPVDLDADGRVDLVLPELSQNQKLPLETYRSFSYDEAKDTWENEAIGTIHAAAAGPVFLDLNADGLPDALTLDLTTGQPVSVLNTGDRNGKRFAATIENAVEYLPGDYASLFSLGVVLDFEGDGRQDYLLPFKGDDGIAVWTLLRSRGDGTFALVEPGIPFEAEISDQGVTIANRLGPRVGDMDGDGTPDLLLPLGQHFSVLRAKGARQDMLSSIRDGLNAFDAKDMGQVPTVSIEYGGLIDRSITAGPEGKVARDDQDYLARGPLAPECAYPLRCVVGPRQVVTGYAIDSGVNEPRRFRVQYREGRYDRHGRGFLGFGAKITSEPAVGSGTIEVFGDTASEVLGKATVFPRAGLLTKEIRWTLDPTKDDPSRIALSFANWEHEVRSTNGGATYFLMETGVETRREQAKADPKVMPSLHDWLRKGAEGTGIYVGGSKTAITDYDDFGNVLGSIISADEVDLVTVLSDVAYKNDTDKWILGKPGHRKECSSAAGIEQCRTIDRTYDGAGLLKTETLDAGGDPSMHVETMYGRDDFGNVTSVTAKDGLGNARSTSTTWTPDGMFPKVITNALGQSRTVGYDPGFGVLVSVIDENNLQTSWKLDAFGRANRELRPDGTEATRTMIRKKDGGKGHDRWAVRVTETATGRPTREVEYDSRARPVRFSVHATQTGDEPPPRLIQEVAFDAQGEHIARRSLPVVETVPEAQWHWDEYAYDPTGRVLSHTTPWKAVTRYAYEGRSVIVTEPKKKPTIEEHDALGRLSKVTDAENGVTSYAYGPFGSLWTVTDPGLDVTTTLRDAYGRVRTSIDPDRGTTILGYDGFGDVVSKTDALGRSVTLTYDALGRLTARKDQAKPGDPVELTKWIWDTALLGSKGALAVGMLAEVHAPGGASSVSTYDEKGRLIAVERMIDGELFGSSIDYDAASRVSTITYPSAAGVPPFAVKQEYDPEGHLIRVHDPAKKGISYWKLDATDEADRISAESFGNGFTTSRSYYPDRGAILGIHTTKGNAVVQELGYAYDEKQNLTSRHDALQLDHPIEHFQYDGLDRLTCATFADAVDCPLGDQYVYAPNGNLAQRPGIADAYIYDPDHPHAVASAGADAFAYDAVGNQTERTGAIVTYTPFDLPASVTPAPGKGAPVTLSYDGDQQRVRKTAGDEVTIYVGDLYERTTNTQTGAVEHRFLVHNGERTVAVVSYAPAMGPSPKTRYLHVDHLGSVETITGDEGDKALEKRSYDALGARRNPAWGSPPAPLSSMTTFGFTGHEDDEDLDLVNMKGRLYDPKVGRFLTPDPFVPHPGFGQSYNRYSYVLNNPLRFVDPSGFDEVPASFSQMCSGCSANTFTYPTQGGTVTVTVPPLPLQPPPPRPAPPPPDVCASLAGLSGRPVDLGATGNAASPPPAARVDGAGGGAPDPLLTAGGGGADSGWVVRSQLTPADYAALRQNATEESHKLAVMAVLAPLRYPVVVGVVAYGILNPDPAYAPTPETKPEDRPSDLERIGDVGFAAALGAAGIKVGQWMDPLPPQPKAYSVAFEVSIPKAGAGYRGAHFKAANEIVLAEVKANPALASSFDALGIQIPTSGAGTALPRSPGGWTWHHVPERPGVLQLVPTMQHQGGAWQALLHPSAIGGFKLWGNDY
ncbi:MAG: FG-GAP-like repeat-containing protein [Byssovorax sp.]